MNQPVTTLKTLGALALLAFAAACANTQSKENALAASGFKVITPTTSVQEAKLKALPPNKVALIQKGGKPFYVFPDVARQSGLRRRTETVPSLQGAPCAAEGCRRKSRSCGNVPGFLNELGRLGRLGPDGWIRILLIANQCSLSNKHCRHADNTESGSEEAQGRGRRSARCRYKEICR